jgi:hypothetical protein
MCSKQLKEPPLCSKKEKNMEKITNTKAANNFYFLPERNSHLINKYKGCRTNDEHEYISISVLEPWS